MRVNSTTNLKIACVIGCENNRDVCKIIHLRVEPEATDEDFWSAKPLPPCRRFPCIVLTTQIAVI